VLALEHSKGEGRKKRLYPHPATEEGDLSPKKNAGRRRELGRPEKGVGEGVMKEGTSIARPYSQQSSKARVRGGREGSQKEKKRPTHFS